MGSEDYDYGKKRRTTSNGRRAEWWAVWPWLILGGLVAIGASVLASLR